MPRRGSTVQDEFGERGDGGFTLAVEPRAADTRDPALLRAAQAPADRGAEAVKGGKAGVVRPADDRILYVPINSVLENADALNRTDEMRKAIGEIPGARSYFTGAPAINHDTHPLYRCARSPMRSQPLTRAGLRPSRSAAIS
jgi:hypothetical protein